MMAQTTRIQIVSYVHRPMKDKLTAVRMRAAKRAGHPISESAFVESIIRKHLAKLVAA